MYQVKKYAAQPTSSQRSKIKKSLQALLDRRTASEVAIKRWHLVLPVNPTPATLKWFTDTTDPLEFPCVWSGLDFLDGLAAELPDVPDYYFREGKERLAAALADFALMLSPGSVGASGEVQPSSAIESAIESVMAAHRLINKLDPHFRYDFAVDSNPPNLNGSEGFVFAETRGVDDQYFTFKIYEKYRGALADRPITLNATFRTPELGDQNALRDFIAYGAPLELGPDLATIQGDLPGGLAGHLRGAIRVLQLPSSSKASRIVRMRAVDVATSAEAVIKVRMPPATSGIDGKNLRAVATEEGESFTVENRFTDEDSSWRFTFDPLPLSGKSAGRVLPGLKFLHTLREGNTLQVGPEFGPYLGDPMTIPNDLSALVDERVVELVESIDYLQGLTSVQLEIPNLDELSKQAGEDIVIAAKLLQGETVTTYVSEFEVVPNGSPVPDSESAIFIARDMNVAVGAAPISVGVVGFHSERVIIALESDESHPDGVIRVRAVGGGKIKGTLRVMPAE